MVPSPVRPVHFCGAAPHAGPPGNCLAARPGHAATRRLWSCPTLGATSWSSSPLPGLQGTPSAPLPCPGPSPNPAAAGPDGRRVLSRVGAADHAVTPKAPWTGSGWRRHSYGGFGGGHPHFHPHFRPHAFCRQPYLYDLHYQLGKQCRPGLSHGLTCRAGCPRVTVRDPSLPGLMAR